MRIIDISGPITDGMWHLCDPMPPVQPQDFFPRFFRADVLLLAPAVRLTTAQPGRWCLIALPLKIVGACASPVRALLVDGPLAAHFAESPPL